MFSATCRDSVGPERGRAVNYASFRLAPPQALIGGPRAGSLMLSSIGTRRAAPRSAPRERSGLPLARKNQRRCVSYIWAACCSLLVGRDSRPAFGNGPPSQFAPGRAISVAGGGLRPPPDPQSAVEGLIRTMPTGLSSAGSNRIDLRVATRHLTQRTARIELAQPGLVRACAT